MCNYYVKEYRVVLGKWVFPNTRKDSGMNDVYSHFYLSHLHRKQKRLNSEKVNKWHQHGYSGYNQEVGSSA